MAAADPNTRPAGALPSRVGPDAELLRLAADGRALLDQLAGAATAADAARGAASASQAGDEWIAAFRRLCHLLRWAAAIAPAGFDGLAAKVFLLTVNLERLEILGGEHLSRSVMVDLRRLAPAAAAAALDPEPLEAREPAAATADAAVHETALRMAFARYLDAADAPLSAPDRAEREALAVRALADTRSQDLAELRVKASVLVEMFDNGCALLGGHPIAEAEADPEVWFAYRLAQDVLALAGCEFGQTAAARG